MCEILKQYIYYFGLILFLLSGSGKVFAADLTFTFPGQQVSSGASGVECQTCARISSPITTCEDDDIARILLDGSSSTAQDGGVVIGYSWARIIKDKPLEPVGNAGKLSYIIPLEDSINKTAIQQKLLFLLQVTYNTSNNATKVYGRTVAIDIEANTAVQACKRNTTPVANAGADQSAAVAETLILDGSGSNDTDGDTLTYNWSLTAPAGSTAVLSYPTSITPTFTLDLPGKYTAQLIVNDGTINSKPDTVTISTRNSAPVADAGADQTAIVTESVTLDGSSSTDVDGDPLTYNWSLTTPTESTATLSTPDAIMPTFMLDKPGDYIAQLIVNDGTVGSVPDTVTVSTRNSAPVADAGADQNVAVTETVTLDGTSSSDADGDALTYRWSLTTQPSGSGALLSNLTTPAPFFIADFPGTYTAQLIVNDGIVDSTPDTVNISTRNSAPIAHAGADQSATVTDTVTLDGSSSNDVDGDLLTYSWSLTTPAGSAAVLSGPTTIAPVFTLDLPGTYIGQLIVNDGTVDSTPDTMTVSTSNSAPVAQAGEDQTAIVTETVTLNGASSSDVDGDALTYSWSLTTPAGSAAVLSGPTTIIPAFTIDLPGTYIAQLIVNDGTVNSAPDTVTISTRNSVPVADAGADQSAAVTESVTLDGTRSSDADGDSLTYQWSLTTRPAGSRANLSDDNTVSPGLTIDAAGTYIAQLIVNDGTADSTPDTVTISTRNSVPVADAGENQELALGTTATLDGSDSSDVDSDPLSYNWSLLSKPPGSAAALSATNIAMPTFKLDKSGDYIAQLIVNDGAVDSSPATVTITSSNTAPTALPQSLSLDEDTSKTITLEGTDTETDDSALSFTIVTFPSHGSLGGSADPDTSVVSGSLVTYTPEENYSGPDSFSFKANDGDLDSAAATITLDIGGINDAPTALPQTLALDEDTSKIITLTGTDPENDELTYTVVTNPIHGYLSNVGKSDRLAIDTPVTGNPILYTSYSNYSGLDSFTFKVNDGNLDSTLPATITLDITPINDKPIATPQTVDVNEDTPKTFTLSGTDVETEDSTLTYTVLTFPSHGNLSSNVNPEIGAVTGNSVTYTPESNYNSSDSFTFKANDGTVDSNSPATVTLNIMPINDDPIAVLDSGVTTLEDEELLIDTAYLLQNDSDVDDDTLSITAVRDRSNGHGGSAMLVSEDTQIIFTPDSNFNGLGIFEYIVSDGNGGEDLGVVFIGVIPVNDPPTATPQMVDVIEDTPETITLEGADTETDDDTLTFTIETFPMRGELGSNVDSKTGEVTGNSVTYTPDENYNKSDSFSFRANDGELDSAVAAVTLTIAPVNDRPTATPQTVDVVMDMEKEIILTGTDPDGGMLTAEIVTNPSNGTLLLVRDAPNTRAYAPDENFTGTDSFTFKMEDAQGLISASATVDINVGPPLTAIDPPYNADACDYYQDRGRFEQNFVLISISPDELATPSAESSDENLILTGCETGDQEAEITINPDGKELEYRKNAPFPSDETDLFACIVKDESTDEAVQSDITVKYSSLVPFGCSLGP